MQAAHGVPCDTPKDCRFAGCVCLPLLALPEGRHDPYTSAVGFLRAWKAAASNAASIVVNCTSALARFGVDALVISHMLLAQPAHS